MDLGHQEDFGQLLMLPVHFRFYSLNVELFRNSLAECLLELQALQLRPKGRWPQGIGTYLDFAEGQPS